MLTLHCHTSVSAFKVLVDPPSVRAGTVNVNNLIDKTRLIVNLLDVQRLDLLAVCETWLTSEVPSSFVDTSEYSEYNLFSKDIAYATRKHGIGSYIRKNMQAVTLAKKKLFQIILKLLTYPQLQWFPKYGGVIRF